MSTLAIPVDQAGSVATSFKDEVRSKKATSRIALGENVYSVLVVAPWTSWSFIFSIAVVCIKLIALSILITDIDFQSAEVPGNVSVTLVKFLLIPVAIAMQEDLIESFATLANGMWCPSLLDVSTSATHFKVYFGYVLRGIDGCLSLYVNYSVMLITDKIVAVFLNFAALQFIYAIDDVFFELMSLGFFGDQMEHMTTIVTGCTLRRRFGDWNFWIGCIRVSWLDTIMFFFLLAVCYIGYIVFNLYLYQVGGLSLK